jgi:hypothetical protein
MLGLGGVLWEVDRNREQRGRVVPSTSSLDIGPHCQSFQELLARKGWAEPVWDTRPQLRNMCPLLS